MTYTLKVRHVGSTLGVFVSKAAINALNVKEGDQLFLTQGQEGFRIVADDPNFAKAMASYHKVARKYRNTLEELAK